MSTSTTVDIDHVHPAQLSDWLAANLTEDITPVILDVREPWEVQRASVKPANSNLVVIPMMQLQARMAELKRDVPIAVLCHHGVRSLQVARFLAFNGFSTVANISGGIDAWAIDFDAAVARY
jgi:rhodanese-related sulfurtransferase